MKTPEQIAEAIIYDSGNRPESWTLSAGGSTLFGLPPAHGRKIRAAIIAAIEADRAQRTSEERYDQVEQAIALAFEGEGEAWSDNLSGDRLASAARRALEERGL